MNELTAAFTRQKGRRRPILGRLNPDNDKVILSPAPHLEPCSRAAATIPAAQLFRSDAFQPHLIRGVEEACSSPGDMLAVLDATTRLVTAHQFLQPLPSLYEWQIAQIFAIQPQQIEAHKY
jgi:hypothetical protein